MKLTIRQKSLTVTPYFKAIPCSVSPLSTMCFISSSCRFTWFDVLPYRFNCLPESLIDFLSSNSRSSSMFSHKITNENIGELNRNIRSSYKLHTKNSFMRLNKFINMSKILTHWHHQILGIYLFYKIDFGLIRY